MRDSARDFARIFDEHRHGVHAYFLGRTGDRELAADLMQETFLRVWRRQSEVAGLDEDRLRAWIFTVARNLAIDTYRSRATGRATEALLRRDATEQAPAYEQPEARAELTERIAVLDKAVNQLPEKLRATLTMHVVGGMSGVQIAEVLDEPAGTIRYRLSQARRQLAATIACEES